jgi:hypothetical protein
MSFILDALKKSESERHRHSGPVLMDVRIAPPRRRLPAWAWIIVAVLVINLLVLAWLLWFSPRRATTQNAVPAAAAPAGAATAAPASPAAGATQGALPAAPAPAGAPPPASALPEPALPPAATAQAPVAAGAPASAAPAPVINIASLPRYQDLTAAGLALPTLVLNLHVHDPVPANRYVLLNGSKVREGETLPDGLKILQIVPSGVALEWRGQRFFLNAGG